MATKTEKLRAKLTELSGKCYSQELSACPKHPIFQPQKFINLVLQACKEAGLKFVETVTPPSLQDPGADTYPIVREIELVH